MGLDGSLPDSRPRWRQVVAGVEAGEIDHHRKVATLWRRLIDHRIRDVPPPELTFRRPDGHVTAKTDGSR